MSNPIEELYDFTLQIYCGYRSWPDDVEVYCQVTYPARGNQEAITIDYTDTRGSLATFIGRATQDIAAYLKDPDEWTENYIAHSSEDWRKLKQAEVRAEHYRADIASYRCSILRDEGYLHREEMMIATLQEKLKEKHNE